MEKDKHKTKVKFLMEKSKDNLPCGVFAFFPEEHYHHEQHPQYKKVFSCYAHVGQHSACNIEYAKECELATIQQYADLKQELESLGYNLTILNKRIDSIVYPVSSKYGAPMGRTSYDERPTLGKFNDETKIVDASASVFDCAVPMSSCGAYDKGGAYWGIGKQLRVKYTKDLNYVHFYRRGEE